MKRLLLLMLLLITATQGFSQSKGISYQAVILNPNPQEIPGANAQGNLLANSAVSIQFTVINSSGTEEYQELHSTRTDRYGMINLLIGTGAPTGSNDFSDIFWDGMVKKLKVAIDFKGGSNFSPLSEQNLTYMPQPPTEETTIEIASNTAAIATERTRAINSEQANATGISTLKTEQTTQNAAIALNTAKVGITPKQASTIGNTTGINTGDQDISGIAINAGAITSLQGEQTMHNTAIGLNTAKTGITSAQATTISNTSGINTGDQDLSGLVTTTSVATALNLKVDKEAGKGLSANNYTTIEKTKLTGIAPGAEVNIQSDWNQTTNTADDYIKNKPTIPTAADGSETKVTAGTNLTVTGGGTIASPYVVNAANELQNIEQVLILGNDANGNNIVNTGKIGIGTATPNAQSSMEIATALPVIFPSMTQTQVNAITVPVEGMVQFNSDAHKLQVYAMLTDNAEILNEIYIGNESGPGGFIVDQSFTSPIDGQVIAVELMFKDANGGFPDIDFMGQGIYTVPSYSQFTWHTFILTSPMPVTAGVSASFVFIGPGVDFRSFATNSNYPNGSIMCCLMTPDNDVLFRVHIQPLAGSFGWQNMH